MIIILVLIIVIIILGVMYTRVNEENIEMKHYLGMSSSQSFEKWLKNKKEKNDNG